MMRAQALLSRQRAGLSSVRRTATGETRVGRRWVALSFIAVVTVLADPSHPARAADSAPATVTEGAMRRERFGLDLALGLGSTYGAIGLQARFDVPVRRWLLVAPFAAGGFVPKDASGWAAAPAVGVSVSAGRRFRLALDLGLGPIDAVDVKLHGTVFDTRVLFGPLVAVGLEVTRENGAYFRVSAGLGWPERPPLLASRATFVLNLGVGVRAL